MTRRLKATSREGLLDSSFFEKTLLERLNRLYLSKSEGPHQRLKLDLSQLYWGDLLELMALIGVAWYLRRHHNTEVIIEGPNEAIQPTMARMLAGSGFAGLATTLNVQVKSIPQTGVDTFSLFRFSNIDNFDSKDRARIQLDSRLRSLYGWMSSTQRLGFDKIINEVLENILEHAYDAEVLDAPRLFSIRRFSTTFLSSDRDRQVTQLKNLTHWLRDLFRSSNATDFLEIAILDVGNGIRSTILPELEKYKVLLAKRSPIPAEIDHLAALKFVLSSTKTTSFAGDRSGRGFGLYKLKNHVQAWGGLFFLRSGTARLIYNAASGDEDETRKAHFFPGTQIRVLLPVQERSKNVSYVLKNEAKLR